MELTAEQRALLPSDDDVTFYREHGWYISKKILSDEIIDLARVGSERHFAGERDVQLPIEGGRAEWKPGDGNTIRNCEFVTLQNLQIRQLVQEPLIGAIAARLAGSRAIRLFDDQLIYKPPDAQQAGTVVGWHVDRAYWMTCTSDDMLTAWVPFHDCPEEMGPLVVIDRSHKWPGTTALRTFKDQNLEQVEARYCPPRTTSIKIPIVLKKGQVSFHHCLTVHGSDVNRGKSPRVSLAIHMQDDKNRYRTYLNEQGVPWRLFNDQVCRRTPEGHPDYTDSAVFPTLWSESEQTYSVTHRPA